jgi:hypothetical protein
MTTKTCDDELAAITLMSEDIDNIIEDFEPIFDVPASVVEAIVGLWLLWRQLGFVSLAPILILGSCAYLQKLVGDALNQRRAIWTKAIQKRVGLTTNILRSMKSVKMSGLVGASAKLVQAERVRELQLGKSFRWFVVWMNAFGEKSAIATTFFLTVCSSHTKRLFCPCCFGHIRYPGKAARHSAAVNSTSIRVASADENGVRAFGNAFIFVADDYFERKYVQTDRRFLEERSVRGP